MENLFQSRTKCLNRLQTVLSNVAAFFHHTLQLDNTIKIGSCSNKKICFAMHNQKHHNTKKHSLKIIFTNRNGFSGRINCNNCLTIIYVWNDGIFLDMVVD